MGDMLLATPLLRAVKNRFPDGVIDVLSEPLPAQVLRHNPHLRRVIIAETRRMGLSGYMGLIADLRKSGYDIAIDLISTPGSALLAALSGAPCRIGFRLRWRSWAYSFPIERDIEPRYYVLTKFLFVKDLGIEPRDLTLDLFIDDDSRRWADEKWQMLNLERYKPVIGLAPWSKRLKRRWDIDAWMRFLIEASATRDIAWILFGSENERVQMSPLLEVSGLNVFWAGADDILKAAALMKKCRLLVGVDNGLKHIAVAVGTPTLTVFVSSDPRDVNAPDDAGQAAVDYRIISGVGSQVADLLQAFVKTIPLIEVTAG